MIGVRTGNRIATSGGACVFLLVVMTYVRPEFFVVLLAGFGYWALLLGILVAFGFGVAEWSGDTRFWMIPALICAAFAAATHWAAVPVGRAVGDWEFRLHLDEYKSVVEVVAAGNVPGELDAGIVPHPVDCREWVVPASQRRLPHRIVVIWAKRCSVGMTVEFLVGTDVPTLHEGYVFRGYADSGSSINSKLRREWQWAYTRHIVGDWYRFADQPGF